MIVYPAKMFFRRRARRGWHASPWRARLRRPRRPRLTKTAPPSTADVPREQFTAKLAKAICDNTEGCCTSAGAVHEPAYCTNQVLKELGWKERVDKATHYDAKHAAACLDEIATLAKKCAGASGDIQRLPSCAATFSAGKKTGEACDATEDCAPPPQGHAFCWTGGMADAAGRCAVDLPAKLGAACFTPIGTEDKTQLVFSECSEDRQLRCDPATNTCGPRVKAGSACDQGYECEEGASCIGKKCKAMAGRPCRRSNECAEHQACTDGKCGPGKKMGEACTDITDCGEGTCTAVTQRCGPWASMFLCKAPAK